MKYDLVLLKNIHLPHNLSKSMKDTGELSTTSSLTES